MEFFGYLFVVVIWMMAHPLAGVLVYLLPVIFALILKKQSTLPIVILTILLGWFFPAWILFLLWSVFGETKSGDTSYGADDRKDRLCQFCTTFFPKEQTICPKCGKEQREIDV